MAEREDLAPGEDRLPARSGIRPTPAPCRSRRRWRRRDDGGAGRPGQRQDDPAALPGPALRPGPGRGPVAGARSGWGWPRAGSLPILLPLRQIGAFLQRVRRRRTAPRATSCCCAFCCVHLENERIACRGFLRPLADARARPSFCWMGWTRWPTPTCAGALPGWWRASPGPIPAAATWSPAASWATRARPAWAKTMPRPPCSISPWPTWSVSCATGTAWWPSAQMGAGPAPRPTPRAQTRQLLDAIQANERIRELAINPLMLTVIAMVHRDRVKLPDRRAELYGEAVDVLLGKWDEAKGRQESADPGRPALRHRRQAPDAAKRGPAHARAAGERAGPGRAAAPAWGALFRACVRDAREAEQAVDRFLQVIEERAGLLAARGEGVYSFSHLTFQEYLAALAVAAQTTTWPTPSSACPMPGGAR